MGWKGPGAFTKKEARRAGLFRRNAAILLAHPARWRQTARSGSKHRPALGLRLSMAGAGTLLPFGLSNAKADEIRQQL